MSHFDLVIRNARCATASDVFDADIGILDGRIHTLGQSIAPGRREIDAGGRWVLPGGIDSHVHVDQRQTTGGLTADTFSTGSIAAACGGTTTMIPFATQLRGQSLRWAMEEYHERSRGKTAIDYNFHLIVGDPTAEALAKELPDVIADGCTSLKFFTVYDDVMLSDREVLNAMAAARSEGAMVMIHCENADGIDWMTEKLIDRGLHAPKYHPAARPAIMEHEAIYRMTAFAELTGVPLMIVHVSSGGSMQLIEAARRRGVTVYAEACPQYIALDSTDLDKPGMEGAKALCSPPPRWPGNDTAIWQGIEDGFFDVFSSDHSPYRFDSSGKFPHGSDVPFNRISSGVPGVETRSPILFSEGVSKGRIDINRFVALNSTNAAKIYGIYPRKGTIAVGSDADLCIWDDQYETIIDVALLHHAVEYTPYQGMVVKGWPAVTLSRGEVVAEYHSFCGRLDHGRYVRAEKRHPKGTATPTAIELAKLGVQLSV
ncbi:dihydropyrimidinase [Pseudaminobacter soli (ex Li et al. 2025)]|uniref:D-hydantoinase n=1 Tax=Pseudaminobacter soli (ex Li et al. 2025) TaxID=1295366 RepID=A0A2P7S2Z7_9HYPH|nr:dihydropyrimidinase [Mesorhizobium soli]PSJ56857.1 dihydropyrimidinase [Mesorhizobium soli]